MYRLIADKIEREPDLLDIPLRNIERWLARGHSAPHRLRQWQNLILAAKAGPGMRELLLILRDPSEESAHLRSFSPFAGVLSTDERRQFIRECAYSH